MLLGRYYLVMCIGISSFLQKCEQLFNSGVYLPSPIGDPKAKFGTVFIKHFVNSALPLLHAWNSWKLLSLLIGELQADFGTVFEGKNKNFL